MAVRDRKNSGSHNVSRKYGMICRQGAGHLMLVKNKRVC